MANPGPIVYDSYCNADSTCKPHAKDGYCTKDSTCKPHTVYDSGCGAIVYDSYCNRDSTCRPHAKDGYCTKDSTCNRHTVYDSGCGGTVYDSYCNRDSYCRPHTADGYCSIDSTCNRHSVYDSSCVFSQDSYCSYDSSCYSYTSGYYVSDSYCKGGGGYYVSGYYSHDSYCDYDSSCGSYTSGYHTAYDSYCKFDSGCGGTIYDSYCDLDSTCNPHAKDGYCARIAYDSYCVADAKCGGIIYDSYCIKDSTCNPHRKDSYCARTAYDSYCVADAKCGGIIYDSYCIKDSTCNPHNRDASCTRTVYDSYCVADGSCGGTIYDSYCIADSRCGFHYEDSNCNPHTVTVTDSYCKYDSACGHYEGIIAPLGQLGDVSITWGGEAIVGKPVTISASCANADHMWMWIKDPNGKTIQSFGNGSGTSISTTITPTMAGNYTVEVDARNTPNSTDLGTQLASATCLLPVTATCSLADYMNLIGRDSSFDARYELAIDLGIVNYAGTSEQNTALLNNLRNGTPIPEELKKQPEEFGKTVLYKDRKFIVLDSSNSSEIYIKVAQEGWNTTRPAGILLYKDGCYAAVNSGEIASYLTNGWITDPLKATQGTGNGMPDPTIVENNNNLDNVALLKATEIMNDIEELGFTTRKFWTEWKNASFCLQQWCNARDYDEEYYLIMGYLPELLGLLTGETELKVIKDVTIFIVKKIAESRGDTPIIKTIEIYEAYDSPLLTFVDKLFEAFGDWGIKQDIKSITRYYLRCLYVYDSAFSYLIDAPFDVNNFLSLVEQELNTFLNTKLKWENGDYLSDNDEAYIKGKVAEYLNVPVILNRDLWQSSHDRLYSIYKSIDIAFGV